MKKIYLLLSTSMCLLFGGLTSCDDGSLDNKDVNIPDPVEVSDEDDGYSNEPTTQAVIKILPQNKFQEIDGFGCNFGWAESVYGSTKREQMMDDLYGENGLRFNIYRGEVCASSASEDGKTFNFRTGDNYNLGAGSSEQRLLSTTDAGKYKEYAQLWIIDYLCKRKRMDIYYFFSVWSPPVIWKTADGEAVGSGNGAFNSRYSDDYAKFLTGFTKAFKDKFGINVYGISGWNEPDQAMGGWDGCIWGKEQMADFVHDYLRPELNRQGCNSTKIVYGELPWWANSVQWIDYALSYKPELKDDDIVAAGHGYSTVDSNILPMESAEKVGIHVWQTETCDDKTRDETWNDAMKWAKNYHDYLTKARTNAVVWWAGARYCTSTGENLLQTDTWDFSNSYYRIDRYYSIGQFSRYIDRGSIRVDVSKTSTATHKIPRDLNPSAYIKDDTYTLVLVNSSKTRDFDALLEIDGYEFESMISYTSSASVKWLRKKLNPSMSGKRSVTVPKYSVVTIKGKLKDKGTQTN